MSHQFFPRYILGLLVVQTVIVVPLEASGDNNGRGTKAVALGNSFVSMADNAWAILYNPAGLYQIKSFEASTFVVPNQFGLAELKTVALVASIPADVVTIGAEVEQFGFDLYKESYLRLGIGAGIDRNVAWGITLNLGRLSIERYGSSTMASADVGLLARVQNDLQLGFAFHNVFGAKVASTEERQPQIVAFGVHYDVLTDFGILVEMEKDVRFPAIMKGGVEKSIFEFLTLRAGISNNPDKFSLGLSVRYADFEFGYAGYSHVELGWTHQIEVGLRLTND